MKKNLKLALIAVATTNLLMANMVFNLGAQHFSNSIDGNFTDSTYDLPKTVVSTSLKLENGHYIPKESGSFKVELKEPKTKWGVTFDMDCYLNTRGSGVTLLGKDSNVLTLFFSNGEISVDGQVKKNGSFRYGKKIVGTVQSDGKAITVIINGKYNFKIEKPNFNLGYIEVNLGTDTYNSSKFFPDKLNGLAITTASKE